MARPASDIRSRIIIAARERFLLEGVDGAALRQIAKDAGTNIGMVYYYFKTKDELFLAIVQDVYGDLLADIERLLHTDVTEAQRFAAFYDRLSRMSADEFAVIRLVMREALVASPRLAQVGQLFLRGHIPVILSTLARGIHERRLREDLPPLLLMAATLILGFLPQIGRHLLAAGELPGDLRLPEPQQIAQGMADILFHGIARTPRASTPER
jgi:AcrR family transcriptional regulator